MSHLNSLFENLDHWRHLPAYQLERRSDVFFSLYLEDIFKPSYKADIEGVIPEFPVRIGTIRPETESNQSFKVDYFVKLKGRDLVLFIELKTDVESRREDQDTYLQEAKSAGLEQLLQGLLEIYSATSAKRKYRCLLDDLAELGFLTKLPNHSYVTNNTQYDIQVVYIQPIQTDKAKNVITFDEIAEIIEGNPDKLSQRFAKSLRVWASTKAGEC